MRAALVGTFDRIVSRDIGKAVLWSITASIAFQMMTASMKALGATLPSLEIAFVRGAAALVLVVFAWRSLKEWRSIRDRRIHLLRAVLGTVALLCSVYALSTQLPLALVSLILYSRILMMIPLAQVALGERSDLRLWASAGAGFAGVVLAVSPALTLPGHFVGVVAMVAAALLSAGSQLAVRRLTLSNPSSLIVAVYALLSSILLSVPTVWVWVPPTSIEAIGLLAVGLFGAVALYCSAQAFRFAPAPIVAPLAFLEIPLAGGLDYLLWAKTPTWQTIVGAFVIVAATYFVATSRSK